MQRGLVVISGVLLALLAIVPVHAEDDDKWDDRVTISGTVWIDENGDGIRQSSEPGAAGVRVYRLIGPYPHNPSWTDERGQYTFDVWPWHRRSLSGYFPGQSVDVFVYHLRNGDRPVWETDWGTKYTHFGCGYVRVEPGDSEHTVDIRVVHHYDGGKKSPPPQDWPLPDGHFVKQKYPFRRGCDAGFSVTNADGIPFWDTWRKLGLENVGYPTSSRYVWRGFVTQTFQKAVFQWRPGKGVFLVNVFDELHDAGYDKQLRKRWATPNSLFPPFNSYLPVGKWEDLEDDLREQLREKILTHRLTLLDGNPAIKERYFSAPDPLWQYGLPTSKVVDYGNVFVIRTQKAVLQQWKEDVPWAKAGEVTIANGVDIAKELSRKEVSDNVEAKIRRVVIHMFSTDEELRRYQAITDSHYPPSRPLWPCANSPQFTCFPD